MRDVSMTLSQIELALLGGLPLRKLDQLIASRCAPIYARPQSRRVACYTRHEAVMLATGMMLHERYGLGWASRPPSDCPEPGAARRGRRRNRVRGTLAGRL